MFVHRVDRGGLGPTVALVVGFSLAACERPGPPERHDAAVSSPSAAYPPPSAALKADVAARIEAAHARFGAGARTRVVADTFVFVLVGPETRVFDEAAASLDRELPLLTNGHFIHRPDAAVTVPFFSDRHGFRDYAEAPRDTGPVFNGVYRPRAREIAVDGYLGEDDVLVSLLDPAAEALVEADFPHVPRWFQAGLAHLFEKSFHARDGSLHGAARDWRAKELDEAFGPNAKDSPPRLDALFGMTDPTFDGAQDAGIVSVLQHHAAARSVCAWMDAHDTLWPFYRAWRDGFAADPTGTKAFAAVFGQTPAARNEEWGRWTR